MTSLQKIEKWINKQGYTLHWGREDCVLWDEKIVSITSTLSRKYKLYSLLHEVGHVILYSKDYMKNYKSVNTGENIDHRHAQSLVFRVKKIDEEMSAWKRGYSLSKKLGIRISRKAYDKYAAKFIFTYIKAVADTTASYHKYDSKNARKP